MFISGAIVLFFLIVHVGQFAWENWLPGPSRGKSRSIKAIRILNDNVTAVIYLVGVDHSGDSSVARFRQRVPVAGDHPSALRGIDQVGRGWCSPSSSGSALPALFSSHEWRQPADINVGPWPTIRHGLAATTQLALDRNCLMIQISDKSLDSEGSRRPRPGEVGPAPLRAEARQPGQQAEVHDHRRRHRAGRRVGAASLAELGYNVLSFCLQDSPRRAHSIAAQGGINAAKNYPNDGDSIWRLFYDTVKGGDFRSREANVYRLAQISNLIIDHCTALGVPFAREYGGTLANRSFGGAQVSRTFYARGQTGQQLLLGAYSAMMRQVAHGKVDANPPAGDARPGGGRRLSPAASSPATSSPGAYETFAGDAVVLCTGGYGNVYYLSTNAKSCNVTAAWRCHKRGAYFANPCFTQIHPTCIPASGHHQSKLTLMSESLRNDGRVWVPKEKGDTRPANQIPDAGPRLLPRAALPGLRQPRAARRRLAGRQGTLRRGLRRRLDAATPSISISATRLPATASRRSAPSTATCSTCTRRSRPRIRTRRRCGSIPPSITRWAACGSTTTWKARSPACSCWARPTSPTTAPIAWAQAP